MQISSSCFRVKCILGMAEGQGLHRNNLISTDLDLRKHEGLVLAERVHVLPKLSASAQWHAEENLLNQVLLFSVNSN